MLLRLLAEDQAQLSTMVSVTILSCFSTVLNGDGPSDAEVEGDPGESEFILLLFVGGVAS